MDIIKPRTCCLCRDTVDLQEIRQCSFCGPKGEEPPYFCILKCYDKNCKTHNCRSHPTCWDAHLPGYEGLRGLHQMIDQLPEIYVNAVTYSEPDPRVQRDLHDGDRIAEWFVVKVGTPGRDQARLCVSDRFRQLCDPGISGNRWSSNQYPSFVSFVGDTGTGKSTLVRAMILMGQVNASELPSPHGGSPESDKVGAFRAALAARVHGPVTRTANLTHLTDPTSSGVHLYKDVTKPYSARSPHPFDNRGDTTPILFADCEGFRGGIAQTNSERTAFVDTHRDYDRANSLQSSAASMASRNQEASPEYINPNLLFDRPITSPDYGSRGKEGAELFYARFLYAFSDVVVFVTKEDQRLQDDMRKLMEWAASAVDKSVNHLAQKTLIIVRNMASRHATEFYDGQFLKKSTFDSLANLWDGSPALSEWRKEYNKKHSLWQRQIFTNDNLFSVFFQKVEVCYIPDKAKAPTDQIFQQYRGLREQIVQASQAAQEIRSRSWTQYNIPTLSHLLNRAFEHFRTSEKPFDFYKAARKDNPNPVSESDHIANFLRHIRLSQDNATKLSPRLYEHLSQERADKMFTQTVSTCLVSWAIRNLTQAYEPEDIFARDLQHRCVDGIRKYCKEYQNCGFKFDGVVKCIARRPGHAEHCDERGRRISGAFDPSEYQEDFSRTVKGIRRLFIDKYRRLCSGGQSAPGLPAPTELKVHREEAFGEFAPIWKVTKSNKTCFTCLQAVPDHILSCGHGYCPDCVKEFGRKSSYYEYGIVMESCPLCQTEWHDLHPQLIRLKPKCAGVRILTLDGGGVRGIIELTILERLEQRIGLRTPIRELFDLVMGTSTGGIIALGLVLTDYTTTDMKTQFVELATEAFKNRREGVVLTAIDPLQVASKALLLLRFFQSIYPTSPLKRGLIQLFGERLNLFSSATVQQQQRSTRVAVTSTKNIAAQRCLITNYNRPDFKSKGNIEPEDDFEREDEDEKEMKVWEACLATASAPFYFRHFEKAETSKNYVDGALHANFPVEYALEEMDNLWAKVDGDVTLDALISVGTGIQKKEPDIPRILEIGGFKEMFTSFHNNMNSQRLWEAFIHKPSTSPEVRSRVHRLNALIKGDYVAIDCYKKMKAMEETAAQQMEESVDAASTLSRDIARAADILTASLFFFEPNPPNYSDANFGISNSSRANELKGSIRCRLARNSQELKRLVDIVEGFWQREVHKKAPYRYSEDGDESMLPSEKSNLERSKWVPVKLAKNWKNDIRTGGAWFKVNCTIRTYDPTEAQQIIAVTLTPPREERQHYVVFDPVAISGFPISFKQLQRKAGY
ncbi:hypothetical protein GP486_001412 [Trichoglossum hirsutum]|uniref:PNPLA domain-containing protein n=1 Tax=Trichoglossum hirsutum TaxID=265104 RepID=A0A9P8LGW8_9PEZI|nr:hypothetical protein GP486_001412 [Trichoglossum hirsutum]